MPIFVQCVENWTDPLSWVYIYDMYWYMYSVKMTPYLSVQYMRYIGTVFRDLNWPPWSEYTVYGTVTDEFIEINPRVCLYRYQ